MGFLAANLMKITGTISVSLYECKLKLIIAPDVVAETNIICRKHNIPLVEGSAEGMFISAKGNYWLILDEKKITHNCIAHETHHAVSRIMDDRCIEDEESRAWICGYITEQIYRFLNKKKIEVKHGGSK